MEKLTLSQMQLISHSLGIDLFNAAISLKKKDKTLPKSFYRNYFNTSKESFDYKYIYELVKNGVMDEFQPSFFEVTNKGIDVFKENYVELVKYKPSKTFDLEYLKHRINFYCDFYNYKFGGDNSEHIISAFQNYFLKGFYMSHTTTDVVNRFKSELKRYNKNNLLSI